MTNVTRSDLPMLVAGTLGMTEELGELREALDGLLKATGRLSHLALNYEQKRRGYADDMAAFRSKVADALADHAVFAHQAATAMRLDYWTLVRVTAEGVMKRNWKTNPLDAHKGEE
jgi:NTP pyrophosphatase (non-canonical NTP hydrolase)